MTKGRRFLPPPDREGIWFSHRGADNSDSGLNRGEATSTGRMLAAPYSAPGVPQAPPPVYSNRSQTMYIATNPFSSHDNKHTIQDRGEYFGDGRSARALGRKLLQPVEQRLHHTGNDFLAHRSQGQDAAARPDYHSVFQTSFTGKPGYLPVSARRFMRSRPDPPQGPQTLATTTTEWQPDPPSAARQSQPTTRVLAISQQPYPKHNAWQYSNKSMARVYPPYGKPIAMTGVDNVFNRYGANFASAPAASR